ncbi:MAG: hypothetical protein QOH30_895, partial [Baekduia sp.]|nr:hypothetical protein [Baekduia sp.]
MRPVSIHAQIEHLPVDRREPVMAWLTASLGDCATCASPVTRSQPRRTGKAGLEHLDCQGAAGG